jgi:DNA-binding transcriptional ArsR family regulator
VLGALSSREAMTAGEVAAATGLGRASVSTTLSQLANSGQVAKADRGYRRAESSRARSFCPALGPTARHRPEDLNRTAGLPPQAEVSGSWLLWR